MTCTKLARPQRTDPLPALLHPFWWVALTVLLLNDHVLKGGPWIAPEATGKISDFAGLLMAPPVLAALARVRSARGWLLVHAGIGLFFAALQLVPAVAETFVSCASWLGLSYSVVSDPSDLIALPMLIVSHQCWNHAAVVPGDVIGAWRSFVYGIALAVGFVGIVATSRPAPASPATLTPQGVFASSGSRSRIFRLEKVTGKEEHAVDVDITLHRELFIADGVLLTPQLEQRYGSYYTRLVAHDLGTGARLWERSVRGVILRPLATYGADFFFNRQHEIERVEARTGNVLWERPITTTPRAAWVTSDVLVLQGDLGVKMQVYSRKSGRLLYKNGSLLRRSIERHGGALLQLSRKGVMRFTPEGLIYDPQLTDVGRHWLFLPPRPHRIFYSERYARLESGDVLLYPLDDKLIALEKSDGSQRYSLPHDARHASVVADEDVVVTHDGAVYRGHHPATGRQLWEWRTEGMRADENTAQEE